MGVRFEKGHKKVGGKKKGSRHLSVITREALEDAIQKSDKDHDKTILTHFIDTARTDSHVLIALMKKVLADRKEVDQTITNEDLKITVTVKGEPKTAGTNTPAKP